MALAFENVQVYQKAVDFADACCERSGDFPRGYYFLQDQLNRAALSITANLAEGTDASPKPTERSASVSTE